jgi:hypothetical protein
VLDDHLATGQGAQLSVQPVQVGDGSRGERRQALVAQERPPVPPGESEHERLAERGGVRGHVQPALEVLQVGGAGTFHAVGHGDLLGADPAQVRAEAGPRLQVAQHVAGGPRPAERAEPLVEAVRDGGPRYVRAVGKPGQVPLVRQRPHQVVGGGEVQPAPARDGFDGQGRPGAHHLKDAERAPDTLHEVAGFLVAWVVGHDEYLPCSRS